MLTDLTELLDQYVYRVLEMSDLMMVDSTLKHISSTAALCVYSTAVHIIKKEKRKKKAKPSVLVTGKKDATMQCLL